MGRREGLDCTIQSMQHVYEFHQRYRAFLRDTVEGYVFDNKSNSLYVLLSKPCDLDMLEELFSGYDGNVGILHVPKETARWLGQYFSFDDFEKTA